MGEQVGADGLIETFCLRSGFSGFAFLLEAAEFGHFLFAAADEAGFLKVQIAKLLFVIETDLHFDHDRLRVNLLGMAVGELLAANVDEGHFEAWDAVETPAGVDDRLDEGEFLGAGGFEFLLVSEEEGLVLVGVVGGEDDGAAGETGFDGVE